MTEHDLTTPDGLAVYLRAQMKALGPGDPQDAFQVILVELLAELFKRVKALEPKDSTWRCLVCGKPAIYPRPTCSKACDERGMENRQAGKSVGAPKVR